MKRDKFDWDPSEDTTTIDAGNDYLYNTKNTNKYQITPSPPPPQKKTMSAVDEFGDPIEIEIERSCIIQIPRKIVMTMIVSKIVISYTFGTSRTLFSQWITTAAYLLKLLTSPLV